jgi:HlyD family secretion protein
MTGARKRLVVLAVALVLVALGLALIHGRMGAGTSRDKPVLYSNIDIRQVDLTFNKAERIAYMFVEGGQVVKKGHLWACLDDRIFKLTVERARPAVKAQTQVVARLEAG